jgi:hypothetical protein
MTATFCNPALTLPRLALAFLIILAVYLFQDSWTSTHYKLDITTTESHHDDDQIPIPDHLFGDIAKFRDGGIAQNQDERCIGVPGADDVLVMLKTGATEIYEKLPTHFVTLFKCIPHYMVFSDLAQDFADFPVRDAIAPVSKLFREQHKDFNLYRKLQKYQRQGQDTSKLKGDKGWDLDKWKFLPMLFEAFEDAPSHIKWFVMMEADTSLSWTNLLLWLKTMDPDVPQYLGSQNFIDDTAFAHGGSGIVISRQAASQLRARRDEEGKEAYNQRWEEITSTSCCGDEIVARALLEANVPMSMAWPLIQGETISTVDFTDNHWCSPPITWHHVSPIEVDALWQFEANWIEDHGWNTPYLYRDIFANFIDGHISANRHGWNNLSQDKKLVAPSIATSEDLDFASLSDFEQDAVKSPRACEEACTRQPDESCLQWMFTPGRCYLGDVVRFGKTDEKGGYTWISGWIPERVERYKERLGNCSVVNWRGV